MLLPVFLVALLFQVVSPRERPLPKNYDTHDYYVLQHDPAHGYTPQECSNALGLELVQPLGELDDHWVARVRKDISLVGLPKRSLDRRLNAAIKSLERQLPYRLHKRVPSPPPFSQLSTDVASRLDILDPSFRDQWHIINDQIPQHSLNVVPVWDMGYTGTGVTVAMIDDGVDFDSADLAENFDYDASYDFNTHQPHPKPLLSDDTHGTRCAGQIAAAKNDICGIGIAHTAKVAGLRILSGRITAIDESSALNYRYNTTHIYSCSWGPRDDGMTLEAPKSLIQKAFLNGVTNGRQGKGSVFVFASGNGAGADDSCGFDGYNNAIWTVTIGSVNDGGWAPLYSEGCAAMMAVTYSSGSRRHRDITTTDVGYSKCTSEHGGTSAAAPFASGIIALALSARPDLTWRDIQHLIVQSATIIDPEDTSWEPTLARVVGRGQRFYSHQYGWGKLDAEKYVRAALNWTTVKPQAWLRSGVVRLPGSAYTKGDGMQGGVQLTTSGVNSTLVITSQGLQNHNLDSAGLEHVNVRVWIKHTRRGDVDVKLTSPNGIVSHLGKRRERDAAESGFEGWTFMSVKHWSESPLGTWTITVSDLSNSEAGQLLNRKGGSFLGWSMTLFGSSIEASKAIPFTLDRDLDLEDWNYGTDSAHEDALETMSTVLPKPSLPPQVEDEASSHTILGVPTEPLTSEVAPGAVVKINPVLLLRANPQLAILVSLSGIFLAGMTVILCIWARQRGITYPTSRNPYHHIDVALDDRCSLDGDPVDLETRHYRYRDFPLP